MTKVNHKNNTNNYNELDTKSNNLSDTFIKKSDKDLRKGFRPQKSE